MIVILKEIIVNHISLSENYFQHADHFIRIFEEQEKSKPVKNLENSEKNDLKKNNIEDNQDKTKQLINS